MSAGKTTLMAYLRVREDDPRIDIAHDLAVGDVVHLQTEKHYLTGRWAPESFALFHEDPMTLERIDTLGELLMLWFTTPLPGSARYRCACGCNAWTGDRFLLARHDQEVLRATPILAEAGPS